VNDINDSGNFQVRWILDMLFSFYSALLIVTSHEASSLHWSISLRHHFASRFGPEPPDDGYQIYVVAFCLIWASALAIFLCLRFASRFAFGRTVLGPIIPVIAVAGFPLASLYSGNGRMPFLEIELAILGVFVAFWAFGKRLVALPTTIFILTLHFALWAWLSKFPYLCCLYLWPGWIWSSGSAFGARMRLVYPILGWCVVALCTTRLMKTAAT